MPAPRLPLPNSDRAARTTSGRIWASRQTFCVLLFPALMAIAAAAQNPVRPGNPDAAPDVDPMSLLPQPKTLQSQRVPIFFPPAPPPLDVPVAHGVVPPGRLAAPPELAMFVNETFYPALSTHLFANTLYADQRAEVGRYHAAKLALQKELRAELKRLREAEPAERRRALETFARTQTPKIVELEDWAEKLRRKLVSVDYSWSILREWSLQNREKRGFSPLEVARVMRGYAFYHRGLLLRQRLLLHEITMELLAAVEDPRKAADAQPYFFFSPEPARVLLPPDLPPTLGAQIAAYQAKKSQLKKEIYDAIVAYDGAPTGFWYNPIRTLAKKQAPAFPELDRMAEEIRAGLAAFSPIKPPENRPVLPPILAERIAAHLRARAAAQREATVKADAVIDRTYEVRVRVAYRFEDDGMKYVVIPGIGRNGPLTKAEEAFYGRVQSDLAAVADAYGRRLAELLNEEEEIRRDAGIALGTENRSAIDRAFSATGQAVSLAENVEAYRDYREAVFEPGLSPEQRRLLFDGAIENLDLPLPRGEMQITSRSKTW